MTVMNAKITSCLLGFFKAHADIPNFIVKMELELANKSICRVDMNPAKIPELLELLGLKGFNQLEGQYVQVKFKENLRPNYIKPILATPDSSWFELDNGVFFGKRIVPVDELEECFEEKEVKD